MTLEEIKADLIARSGILREQSKRFCQMADALEEMEGNGMSMSIDSAVSSLEDAINYLDDALNPEEEEAEEAAE